MTARYEPRHAKKRPEWKWIIAISTETLVFGVAFAAWLFEMI